MPRSILAIYTISSSTLSPDVYIHIFWIRSPPTKQKEKKKKNLALHMKQNPPECEEVSVSVTSASGRLGLRGSVRPPQVPAFPQEATVCSPDLPQLGGGPCPRNSRTAGALAGPLEGFAKESCGRPVSGSWQSWASHCQGRAVVAQAWHLGVPFHAEPGKKHS